MQTKTVTVRYDDQPNDIIEHVNEALADYGWEFIDDQQEHDGFCVYTLTRTYE